MTITEPHAPSMDCEACRFLFTDGPTDPDPIARATHHYPDQPDRAYDVLERDYGPGTIAKWVRLHMDRARRKYHRITTYGQIAVPLAMMLTGAAGVALCAMGYFD